MTAAEAFEGLIGTETPGGCERCDAVQTVKRELLGVYRLTVHHERRCPVLRAHRRRGRSA